MLPFDFTEDYRQIQIPTMVTSNEGDEFFAGQSKEAFDLLRLPDAKKQLLELTAAQGPNCMISRWGRRWRRNTCSTGWRSGCDRGGQRAAARLKRSRTAVARALLSSGGTAQMSVSPTRRRRAGPGKDRPRTAVDAGWPTAGRPAVSRNRRVPAAQSPRLGPLCRCTRARGA